MNLQITLKVNGEVVSAEVEARRLLADFLRDDLALTGTHLGCEQGVCGACTVLLNGDAIRSCLTLAVQADQEEITTVEALARPDGRLHPLQEAFHACHALQCGFCTPGFLMTLAAYERPEDLPEGDDEIRRLLSGNLCRCTGYQNIVEAVKLYRADLAQSADAADEPES
jgi:aerobic-type carbon monoxide dehydrogenase small subunit (CoxS/CutS family)